MAPAISPLPKTKIHSFDHPSMKSGKGQMECSFIAEDLQAKI
jgi:hypothetical protein